MKTVIAVYETLQIARDVVSDLVDAGFDRNEISLVASDSRNEYTRYVGDDTQGEEMASSAGTGAGIGAVVGGIGGLLVGLGALAIPGIGPVIAAGPLAATLAGAGIGAAAGGILGALTELGVPEDDANAYAESIRRGNVLVAARVSDDRVNEATRIMEREGMFDLNHNTQQWRNSGWSRFDASAAPYVGERTGFADGRDYSGTTHETHEGERTIPVIEEEIAVGKRQVQGGGVRVTSHVHETPVEEDVRLREERVTVERRPVDREVDPSRLDAFKEDTIEMTESREEAVVAKDARIVEEVVVRKDVDERVETVRDTVRRTDVDVERLGDQVNNDWSRFQNDWQTHYRTNFANRGGSFDTYAPAYQYGYSLGGDSRYTGRRWEDIEADARRDWESRNQGPWEDFKDAVRYGWNRMTR